MPTFRHARRSKAIDAGFAPVLTLVLVTSTTSSTRGEVTQETPSRAMYFDWVNSEWPGTDEAKTRANMSFFQWLHDSYGMQLDLYMLDAGNLDRSPWTLPAGHPDKGNRERAYGLLDDPRMRAKFPGGMGPLAQAARGFGAQMGMWMGPDGFGKTPERAWQRVATLVSLCRDFGFGLFKLDAACTDLPAANTAHFVNALKECRKYVPDLIALNHRITLSPEAKAQTSTFLWEGRETYVDVHIWNETPAPHHRGGALARGLPPDMQRLTEDHGVCFSSALEGWDDDLVLQAFNRNLIVSPEIYGNPFLLRDDEFPRLARIFRLHRAYRKILVHGQVLPERDFGPHAVARGDATLRFLSLRNLTWQPVTRRIRLDESIGLRVPRGTDGIEVRQFHPVEHSLGRFRAGAEVKVTVAPFRALLLAVGLDVTGRGEMAGGGVYVTGAEHHVVRDMPGRPVEIDILGAPGTRARITLEGGRENFAAARLEGPEAAARDAHQLLSGRPVTIRFAGSRVPGPHHRKLGTLRPVPVPADAEALFEATAWAADNDPLEVRELRRSGPSQVEAVEAARKAFFEHPTFVAKGIWDRYAFDGNPQTFLTVRAENRTPKALRLDLGAPAVGIDELRFAGVGVGVEPVTDEAEVSRDAVTWTKVNVTAAAGTWTISGLASLAPRFVRLGRAPLRIEEIEGHAGGRAVDRTGWRASNLFRRYRERPATTAWSTRVTLREEPAPKAFLAVAIPGRTGNDGVWAALRVGSGKEQHLVGAPDRAPSFPANVWEHRVEEVGGNYTFYFPLRPQWRGQPIEVVVLGFPSDAQAPKSIVPEVWLTAPTPPRERARLTLTPR
jgi:hypothetical protein